MNLDDKKEPVGLFIEMIEVIAQAKYGGNKRSMDAFIHGAAWSEEFFIVSSRSKDEKIEQLTADNRRLYDKLSVLMMENID